MATVFDRDGYVHRLIKDGISEADAYVVADKMAEAHNRVPAPGLVPVERFQDAQGEQPPISAKAENIPLFSGENNEKRVTPDQGQGDPERTMKNPVDPKAGEKQRRKQKQLPASEKTADPRRAARQLDMFCADLVDPCLRDQQDAMAIPFFSLEKRKRLKPIVYERDDVKVVVAGLTTTGIATIWDADFLIWVASQLNEAMERGETPTRRLWVVPYQFLLATGRIEPRCKGGKPYKEFKGGLRRLQGTTIETTIKAGGERIASAWSWIDYWEAHEDEKGRISGLEIALSEWFFRRVAKDRAILAIHPDYFLLTGGIERWLYRIARKHCGNNEAGWSFTVRRLYEKYPPGREYRKFKHDLKAVVERDCIPEYHTVWETTKAQRCAQDWVHFSLREGTLLNRRLPRMLRE